MHGRRCIQVHIARGCKGVCESQSACFSPLYVIKTVSFVSQQAPLSKNFYPGSCVCFPCTESFYIGSGHLIIKKVNTQHSHVTRKRNVTWMIFLLFFSFKAMSTSISNLKLMIVGVCAQHELFNIWLFYISHCPRVRTCTCALGTHIYTHTHTLIVSFTRVFFAAFSF